MGHSYQTNSLPYASKPKKKKKKDKGKDGGKCKETNAKRTTSLHASTTKKCPKYEIMGKKFKKRWGLISFDLTTSTSKNL